MTTHDKPSSPIPPTGERLSKRVAALRACSRREAEQYIEGGWVRVNGVVVEEPQHRVFDEKIEIDPGANLMADNAVTLLLDKPADCPDGDRSVTLLCAASHFSSDPSAIRPLKRHFAGLSSLVPLETGASGLLVFTQDWRVARKLTDDAALLEHEYTVEVAGQVSVDTLARLNHGLSNNAQPLPRVKVSINSSNDTRAKLRFAVKGAHLGLLAHLCERVSLKIVGMKRIRIGRVAMTQLPVGQWRYLLPHERF